MIKNLARREAGWYLTVVQMEWLIAHRREESFISHAVTDRGDHPGTIYGQVTLLQTHPIAMSP